MAPSSEEQAEESLASEREATPTATEASGLVRVHLRPGKAGPFLGRHPWVLDKAILRVEGVPTDGEVVDLVSDKNRVIARGIYNSKSRIRVRLYTWGHTLKTLDDDFWRAKLASAVEFRKRLGLEGHESACRVVFSEADGLSGLIVDRYGEYLSLQITSQAMAVRLDAIVAMLVDLLKPRGIMLRTEKGVSQAEGLTLRDGLIWGTAPEGPIFIAEHGLRYGVDLAEGQKTGFYLDQRDNRLAAARYVSGQRVLDMFCYSGAFALNALKHGNAREVLGIDTSEKAVALARANATLNEINHAKFHAQDAFEALDELLARGERFGAVFLDPPKFARSQQSVDDALRAYHRVNKLGALLLDPGGILVTSSCSGHVSREHFQEMLAGVSQKTGRDIQLLEQRGAAPDHPVSATCLETEYLKCFICRVD